MFLLLICCQTRRPEPSLRLELLCDEVLEVEFSPHKPLQLEHKEQAAG